MAQQRDLHEYKRLGFNREVVVPVKEFPKLPDAVITAMRRAGGQVAADAIEQWQREIEERRKSMTGGINATANNITVDPSP